MPQPGTSWVPEGHPPLQPHEYIRTGTAKPLTLFRPATGQLWAKGVLSAPNAVLHPWLKEQLGEILAEIEKKQPVETHPPEAERLPCARWETWLGHPPRTSLPPLRIILVWDNQAEWQMARPGQTFQTRQRARPAYALHGRHFLELESSGAAVRYVAKDKLI